MKSKQATIWIGSAIVLLALLAILLPGLVGRIDTAMEPLMSRAAEQEAKYRTMTNAFRIAAEVVAGHPTRVAWEESRESLMATGYIETRELSLQNRLRERGALQAFFTAFQARFPGVECVVRGAGSDEATATITARKIDFGPLGSIDLFIRQYRFSP